MTVELFLVRHAIAFERDRDRWPDDGMRPLTEEGKQKFRKAAAGLAKWIPRVDRVLTSPLVRARETAQLLSQTARWPKAIEAPELAPQSTPAKVIALLRAQKRKRIAMVGHEPGLSAFLAACTASSAADIRLILKKGSVAQVIFPKEVRLGRGILVAFVPPRALRRMR